MQSFRRVTLRNGVDPDPPRLIKGFKRIVLHPDRSQNAQESLKLYREIFGAHYPAMALLQVVRLLEKKALVEIEATAVVPR